MHKLRGLTGKNALSFRPSLGLFVTALDFRDLSRRQKGEVAQELIHIRVCHIEPELIKGIGRCLIRADPDRARLGLTEFGAIGLGNQGGGDPKYLLLVHAPGQINPARDIAPLVAATHLHGAVTALVEFREVIGLQQHIAELGEGNSLTFALNALFD